MVDIADKLAALKTLDARWLAFGIGPAAGLGSALLPPSGAIVPILVFLLVGAFAAIFATWRKACEALDEARHVEDRCRVLAGRLAAFEHQGRSPAAANPALRTSMAEVTGTVGLLGGVVRELARNVAAQNSDVADIKDSLKIAPKELPPARMETVEPRSAQDRPASLEKPQAASEPPPPAPSPPPRHATEDDLRRMRLVTQAFEADRIELHLQPIIALPQRKIRFYEALARLRLVDGTLLGPSEFLPVLERLGRAPELDRRILNRAMAVARHLIARGSEAIVGVNLSARSVNDPSFLWSLTGAMDAASDILGKIVLELPQESWRNLSEDQKAAIATLRDRGVPMSLDRATDLQFDARALADLGIRFMKLPAELMIAAADRGDDRHLGPETDVRDFATVLRREGIRLIAERVEREEMVPALTELGVPLAQGFVFAAPRAVKAEVIGAPSQQSSGLRRAG